MKRIKLFLMIAVVILLCFIYSYIDKNQYIYDRDQDSNEYINTGNLCEGESLSYRFMMKEDIFDGIKIKVSVSGQSETVDISFRLTSVSNGEIILDENINAAELKNGKFYEMKFPQLQDTEGKEYCLDIEEKNADVLNGVGFYRARQGKDGLSRGINIRGEHYEESLVMRTISHRFDIETFVVLLVFIAYIIIFMKVLYKLFK